MDIFQSIADATRRNIIAQLSHTSPLSVTDLCEGQRMSRQGVSKHLNILIQSDIIIKYKKGKYTMHVLNPEPFKVLAQWLQPYAKKWDERLSKLHGFLGETNEKS